MKASDIKYVYVELILADNSKNKTVVSGLFQGIVERQGHKLIVVNSAKDCIAALNTKFWDIMTIECLDAESKYLNFVTQEADDQKEATELLNDLYTQLKESEFNVAEDPEIIDITKYTEVPDAYLSEKKTVANKSSQTQTSSGSTYVQRPYNNYNQNDFGNYVKTVPKKDPEPSPITRTTTVLPTKEALSALKEKLDRLAEGTYEPQLPETIGGEEVAAGAKVVNDGNDYYGNGYYGC